MPSNKLIISVCSILVLLGLIIGYAGLSYGTGTAQNIITSSGTIAASGNSGGSPSQWSYPVNNVLVNGQFSNGFDDWSDLRGWNGANGWASLDYSNYHLSAPSLRLTPDPYGIDTGNPTGDESSAWAPLVPVSGTQEITIGCWIKTDANPAHAGNNYGAYIGADFYNSGNTVQRGSIDSYSGGRATINPLGSPVLIVNYGSSGWVHVEYTCHSTSSSTVRVTVWMLVEPPYQGGSTVGCNFDDVYVTYGQPTY